MQGDWEKSNMVSLKIRFFCPRLVRSGPATEVRTSRAFRSIVTAALVAMALAPFPALAQSGVLAVDTVHSAEIAGNLLGEPSDVEVAVYTPPGYATSGLRYPVLYLLHGISGTYRDWTGGGYQGLRIHTELDSLIASGDVPPVIVVMPTAMNRYQGSFYADSPVTGDWGQFMARELVAWTDSRYRTIARPGGRGIAGHSMGGFGALTLPMDHPGVYGAAFAMAPCCLALNGDLGPANAAWHRALAFDDPSDPGAALQNGDFYPVAILGMLSVALPDLENPPFYVEFPYAGDGAGFLSRVGPAHDRYRAWFPIERLDERAEGLRRLRALALDTGHDDQFPHIPPGARAFSQRLAELGVPHSFHLYDGDHRNRMRERFRNIVLPFFARHLDAAGP